MKKSKKLKNSKKVKKSNKIMMSRKLHYDGLVIGIPANHVEVLESNLKRLKVDMADFDVSSRTTTG